MAFTFRAHSLIAAAVTTWLFAAPIAPSRAGDPCDETRAGRPARGGLQVQVDPETGAYSMPAPGTLDATPGRAASAATTGVVVTPGSSAAGGFKVTVPDDANAPERTK
jgi:hypothetical protein